MRDSLRTLLRSRLRKVYIKCGLSVLCIGIFLTRDMLAYWECVKVYIGAETDSTLDVTAMLPRSMCRGLCDNSLSTAWIADVLETRVSACWNLIQVSNKV